MKNRQQRRAMAEINVVPYIDVMLVLLVIFMITTPLLSQGVKVSLPQAKAESLTAQREPIIITVDAQGHYYLNIMDNPNVAITPQVLVNRVAAELQVARQQGKQPLVLVKGDSDSNYGNVVQAMVLLQHAGVGDVGLMTEQPQQGKA